MSMLGILPFSRFSIENILNLGDHAIDCTVGNGHDTVFLAKLVGANGHVYGFDIQDEAIIKTKERIKSENMRDRVTLFHTGHEHILNHIHVENYHKIKVAVFNLGYLPGGNKTVVTKSASTIDAIKSLLTMMKKGGLIIIVIYPGHEEGKTEKNDVLAYVKQIDQQFAHVLKYEFINQINNPPFVIGIEIR